VRGTCHNYSPVNSNAASDVLSNVPVVDTAPLEPSLVSIIVPMYNEGDLLTACVGRVLTAALPAGLTSEIILVDDGSTDSTAEAARELAAAHPGRIRLFSHSTNQGKGAAVRTGLQNARGEFGLIQDADLEYDPADYPKLLAPLQHSRADVVYGSRFLISGERHVLYFWHSLANSLLTTACNMAADLNLTDMATGYKAFRVRMARSIPIRGNGFNMEPELTIKFAKRGVAIYEVPVDYHGRTYDEGKKIRARDAWKMLWAVLRYAFTSDIYVDPGARILDALSDTRRFNAWMAATVRPFVGTRVLEVGAGMGNLTRHLSPGRQRYTATDLDPEHLARLRIRFRGRPNLTSGLCDLAAAKDFADFEGQFDTVICLNVLEHVGDAMAGLRNIYSALAPGGRAIILVPQDQAIYGTLDEVLGHYKRYSEADLRACMEAAGFRMEQVLHFNRITRPGWYFNGRILRRTSFGRVQLRIFDTLVPLWKILDKWLPWPSVSVIGIGVRPS
jgi:glycosyltransferase involved in cell wall biosynthesis/phospholipid N-methyltransferase